MWSRLTTAAMRLDAATPPDRDRLIDLLRVAAMLTVALGHWLAAAVTVEPDGTVHATSTLAAVPASQWLTLGVQVMGLFFAISAWSSAATLSGRPVHTRRFIGSRLRRVLLPTGVYVAVWWGLALALPAIAGEAASTAGALVGVQLWFVAVIVLMFAATPALWRAWQRYGWHAPLAATGAALAVDVAHRILEVPLVGWLNFGFVWAVPTLLGFAWHDRRLEFRRAKLLLLVGGTVALAGLVATPWLPLSMVGVDGAAQSNNSPPSTALIALTCVHLGIVLFAAPALRRWLRRPLVWATVVGANVTAMTTYLWHLTALVLGVGILQASGGTGWFGAVGSGRWWATRPLWIALLTVLTVPLVLVFRRVERMALPAIELSDWRLVVAAIGAVAGCAVLALEGFLPDGSVNWAPAAVLAAVVAARAWPYAGSHDQAARVVRADHGGARRDRPVRDRVGLAAGTGAPAGRSGVTRRPGDPGASTRLHVGTTRTAGQRPADR